MHLNDVFWAPRIETNRKVTIPSAFQQCERTQRVYHFERAAKALRGEKLEDTRPPGYPFDDTDLYKVIEGASYTLNVYPDPKLDAYVDGLIAKIAAAQEPDGYIYTTRTINPKEPHRWAGTGALGPRARRQPRALQPRTLVRGGRCPPSRHRKDLAAERRHEGSGPARPDVRSR